MNPKISSNPWLIKKLPEEVKILFKIFGDEIRLVGGSVRDLLLKKKVNDFDFATKFLPQDTIKVLEKNNIKAVPTGVKFGTITAVVNGKNFEITTLRKDFENDGRHCVPEFVDDFFLDAARRDFTINALYLDSKGSIFDYFGGILDLKNKKLQFIGDASARIEEDFLRILRFFRFSCEYAQELDRKGLMTCIKQKNNLKKLSRERTRAEILKMLASAKKQNLVSILKVLRTKKIATEIFSSDLDIKALENLFKLEKKLKFSADLNLKLAALFCEKNLDLKNFAQEICATNSEKKYFRFLNLYFSTNSIEAGFSQKDLKQLLSSFEKNMVFDLYLFTSAKNYDAKKITEIEKNIQFLQKFVTPNFPIRSEDLINLGFSGKKLGDALKTAKKIWVQSDYALNKNDLISRLVGV